MRTSKYTFTDTEAGFTIETEGKPRVVVQLDSEDLFSWHIRRQPYEFKDTPKYARATGLRVKLNGNWRPFDQSRSCDMLNLHRLVEIISAELNYGWKRVERPSGGKHWYGAKKWAHGQTARALNHRIRKRYRRLLAKHVRPELLAVMKRIFAVTYRNLESEKTIILNDAIDNDPYLISDIMNYRAAAHAVVLFVPYNEKLTSKNWMDFFTANTFGHNTSLRKTLMSMPHAMSPMTVERFRVTEFNRPVYGKRQLTWALTLSGYFGKLANVFPFMYTTDEDLAKACDRMGKIVEDELNPNKSSSYHVIAQYIWDAMRDANGEQYRNSHTVNAVLQIAEDFHRNRPRLEFDRQLIANNIMADTATALPPIKLPDDPGIRFLATAQEVFDEAVLMDHCVDLYAIYAVQGKYYLFHVEHKEEMATVAVISSSGRVSQGYGPRNKMNAAAKYGIAKLSTWGTDIAKVKLKRLDNLENAPFYFDEARQQARVRIERDEDGAVNYAALPAAPIVMNAQWNYDEIPF